jgi:hypothetical protein
MALPTAPMPRDLPGTGSNGEDRVSTDLDHDRTSGTLRPGADTHPSSDPAAGIEGWMVILFVGSLLILLTAAVAI